MTITLGVHTKAESAFVSSGITTSSITTQTSGSTFVVFAFGSGDPFTITDSKGNTWTTAGTKDFNGTFGSSICAFVQNAVGGSGHTFTATALGGGMAIMVLELIGAALAGGSDAFNVANPNGATAAVVTPSITTIAANVAVVACAAGSSSTNNAPTSTNGAIVDTISGANFVTGGDSWFIKATAGSASDTLTFSTQTSFDMAAYTISFAPAGGAGGAAIAWIT